MNLDNLQGEELFKELRSKKADLIQAKKASLKFSDGLVADIQTVQPSSGKEVATKAEEDSTTSEDTLDITVVCSTAWICDSHMDVLIDTAYDATVAKRGNSIVHIADHTRTSVSHVGDVKAVYTKELPFSSLGIAGEGTTIALLMDSTVRKDYNETVFKFYKNGKINQHSIGYRYDGIELAMNSSVEDDKKEKAVWDANYPKIINKEAVDKKGYFWLVSSVDVLENSCVLFGSNPITPVLNSSLNEITNSLAQNKSSNQPTTRGLTMTLEEALLAKDSLQAELTNVKATLATATASGKQEEQQRILGILKAATTFNQPIASVEKLVTKGYSADQAVDMFELAAEAKQQASAVNTANAVDAGAIATAEQANNEAKLSSWNAKSSALLQPVPGVM